MRIDTSIQDFLKKINSHILYRFSPLSLLIFFLLSLSFFLSVLILIGFTKDDRHIFVYREGRATEPKMSQVGRLRSGNYFSAKTGKVYYSLTCKAGARVKEVNRIYFKNEAAAKGAGKTLSKLCE